jgi:hypothetical protein
MRRSTTFALILSLLALVGAIGWFLSRSEPGKAPDVKVICAAQTAAGAEFLVSNRSSRPIRLENVITIEQGEAGWMRNTAQVPVSGPLVIGPSSSERFHVAWASSPNNPPWRALFTLHWDAPRERLMHWLQRQPIWKRLPPALVNRRVNAYQFGSPWLE